MTTKPAYSFISILLACTALSACKAEAPPPEASAAASESLDGSKFDVTMVKNDVPNPSTISFEEGQFISSYCATFDFEPSPYATAKADDGSDSFKIEATSTSIDLVMLWEGTIHGDDVEGKITCTKKDGTPEDGYTFTGKRSGS